MARRVNKKFLVLLTVVVVGGCFVLMLLATYNKFIRPHFMGKRDAEQALRQARDYEAKGEMLKAIEFYKKAAQTLSGDLNLQVEYGDKLRLASRVAPGDYAFAFTRQWEAILQANPSYVPALQRLLDAYIELCDLNGVKESHELLHRVAEKLAAVDKNDLRAEAYAHISLIDGWMDGSPVAEEKIDASIARLLEIAKQRPDLSRAYYSIAMAYRKMGQDRTAQNLTAIAKDFFDKAKAVFDEAVKARADSADLYYQYHRFLLMMASERSSSAETNEAKLKETIQKAGELTKSTDAEYVEIRLAQAQYLLSRNDINGGVKLIRDLMKERPDDVRVRLTLAGTLRHIPGERAAAIELLSSPLPDDPSLVGYRAILRLRYEFRRVVELTEARIDAYAEALDDNQRDLLRDRIEESYAAADRLRRTGDDDATLWELQARKLLMSGTTQAIYSAIPLLQKAYNATATGGNYNVERAFLLARAYAGARQDGQAEFLLQQIVERRPTFAAARKMLVQVLIRGGMKTEEAKAHLDVLDKTGFADDPDVIRLRLATLDREKDKAKIDALLTKLPEKTDGDKFNKARVMFAVGQGERAEPLVRAVRDNQQYMVMATRMLVTLNYGKDPEEAKKIVDEALDRQKALGLKEAPELRLLKAAIAKQSPEEIQQLLVDVAENPVDQAIEEYRRLVQKNQLAEALAQLQKAEKLAPAEARVLELLFQFHVQQKKWDEAQNYQQKLGGLNADHMDGRDYKFQLLMAQGKTPDALAVGKEAADLYPEFAQAWVLLGRAQQATNQFDSAKASYKQALSRQPNNQIAFRGIVDCCYRLGQPDEARDFLEKAFQATRSPFYSALLNQHEEMYGDPEKVIPWRLKNLDADRTRLDSWLALARTYLYAGAKRAKRPVPTGVDELYEKSRAILNEAKSNPKWADELDIYSLLVDTWLSQSKPESALAVLKELASRPAWADKAQPPLMMAQIQWRIGRYPEAEALFKQAIDRFGDGKLEAQLMLVSFYSQTATLVPDRDAQLGKAISLLEELAKSNDPSIIKQLVEVLTRANQFDKADALLTKQLAAQPNDADLLALQGVLILSRPATTPQEAKAQLASAEQKFDAALRLNKQCLQALLHRGRIRLRQNRWDLALEDLQPARNLAPNMVETHLAVADAWEKANRPSDAMRETQEALELAPLRRDVRMRLVQLYWSVAPSKAEELLEQAEVLPALAGDPTWWAMHAKLVAGTKAPVALAKIQKARDLAPANIEYVIAHADLLLNYKQTDQARALLEQAVRDPAADKQWRVHLMLAQAKIGQDRDAALAEFDAALARGNDQGSYMAVLQVFMRSVPLGEAISKLTELSKKDSRWGILLALLHLQRQATDEACQTIEQVLQSGVDQMPADRQALVYRAAGIIFQLAATQSREKAEKYAPRAVDAYASLLKLLQNAKTREDILGKLAVLNNLACLYSDTLQPTNLKEAEKYSQAAYDALEQLGEDDTDADPLRPLVLDTHGWILISANKVEKGVPLLEQAVRREPRLIEAAYHLAEGYIKQSNPDLAIEQLDRIDRVVKEQSGKGIVIDESLKLKMDQCRMTAQQMMKRP